MPPDVKPLTTPDFARSKVAAGAELAQHINHLTDLLRAQYGCDFAYVISGNGHVLAASTLQHGYVVPRP